MKIVPNLVLGGEEVTIASCSTYLGSCITQDDSIVLGMNTYVSKAELKRLWRQKILCTVTVLSLPLYGNRTWTWGAQHVDRLEVCDHPCLCSITTIEHTDRGSNVTVRNLILDVGP